MTRLAKAKIGAAAVVLVSLAAPAAQAGQPGLKVFFSSDFTDRAYQQKAFDKVAKSWKMPSETPEEGSKAVVVTTIMKDGRVAEVRLHHESGSKAWDEAAVSVLKATEAFDPLPRSYPRSSVEAHFHFEWNP